MKFYLLFTLLFVAYCDARVAHHHHHEKKEPTPELRVVGGEATNIELAPYQVSIANTVNGEHVCGGSIIDQNWILTAAHCLEWPKQYLKVSTGTNNWTQPEATYLVDDVKVHCQHNKPMYHNDIALIHVSTPIVFNKHTQPVQLATKNTLKPGDKLTLTGWGSVKTWGRYSQSLQKVDLKYILHTECEKKVKNQAWLGDDHICTYTREGEGSCHGDSGGPLVDENQRLVGIVNWGEACAVGYPDVFASVAYFYDWIREMKTGSNTC